MAASRRHRRIRVKEGRLDEQDIRILRERDDLGVVRRREARIHDIGDLAPRGYAQDVVLGRAKRHGPWLVVAPVGPGDLDGGVVRVAAQDGGFEDAQPRADLEPCGFEFVAPDIDMGALLKRERERWNAMIEHGAAHL